MKPKLLIEIMVLGGIVSTFAAEAADLGGLEQALGQAKPIANARLRYEAVDQAGLAENADALTLRLRAGFITGAIADTKLGIDFEWIESLNGDFNSTTNGRTQFPVVADPQDAELNQLYLENTSLPDTTVKLGRQRIVLDDARFVGNVGWRQNEQTFDAVRVTNASLKGLTLDLIYLNQVNRVFGPDSVASPWTGDDVLANIAYDFGFAKLTGFAYLVEARQALANSSQTYGARLAGKQALYAANVAYGFSYARQHDYRDNPFDYGADYYLADLGVGYAGASLGVAYEVLGGNGVAGFSTPLATLHKFQGWADKFLVTPANGVKDLAASAGYGWKHVGPFSTVGLLAVYHDFAADRGGAHYGDEIDLQVQAKWRKFDFIVKYADYNARQFSTDTEKLWLELSYGF